MRHFFFFFFHDTATTEIYTLSLHDALPICPVLLANGDGRQRNAIVLRRRRTGRQQRRAERSEEHTSELQSRGHLVCRLLLEKKKKKAKRSRPRMYRHDDQNTFQEKATPVST